MLVLSNHEVNMYGTHALYEGYKLVYTLIPYTSIQQYTYHTRYTCSCHLHECTMVRTSCCIKEPITDSSLNQHLIPFQPYHFICNLNRQLQTKPQA